MDHPFIFEVIFWFLFVDDFHDIQYRLSLRNPIEEKNEFAMDVLRRVRLKLEGREPDALKRSSVAKQV